MLTGQRQEGTKEEKDKKEKTELSRVVVVKLSVMPFGLRSPRMPEARPVLTQPAAILSCCLS